ncbi:hypothetical protein [Paenibacillus periandrae]|uniref:hypothetical protein n=1 Tax=Paenibacillus periandrae TaxID=1761741 RepID=UPI001F09BCB6|nr:hypothetical protein [Paenibacillus periandrae]
MDYVIGVFCWIGVVVFAYPLAIFIFVLYRFSAKTYTMFLYIQFFFLGFLFVQPNRFTIWILFTFGIANWFARRLIKLGQYSEEDNLDD